MRWTLGNVLVEVHDSDERERAWLGEYLSFSDKQYVPSKNRFKVTRVSLLQGGAFPAGLAPAAFTEAKRRGFKVAFHDARVKPCAPDPNADLHWLTRHPAVQGPITHQTDAVAAALSATRGVLWLPTGAGKTEIAAGIVKALPCRWLFLVHRADLLRQTAARFEARIPEPIGMIGDGRRDVQRVTVCSLQTAHKFIVDNRAELDVLRTVGGIIVDECHAMGAQTFWDVVQACEGAYYRFGLSGTPLARSDARNLLVVGGLGRVIYRIRPEALIQLGLLARPKIRMVEVPQRSDLPTWQGVYGEAIVRSRARNLRVIDVVKQAAKPCLVFVKQVNHGKALAKTLNRHGVVTEFAWGEKSTKARQAAIERLVRGDSQALVCNVVFQEGVDIPSLQSVVIATAGKSPIAAIQRVGRGMRADAKTGKRDFEVWDIADKGCGCSPTDEDGEHKGCKWLDKHARARRRAYEDEGYTVDRVVADTAQLAIAGT